MPNQGHPGAGRDVDKDSGGQHRHELTRSKASRALSFFAVRFLGSSKSIARGGPLGLRDAECLDLCSSTSRALELSKYFVRER